MSGTVTRATAGKRDLSLHIAAAGCLITVGMPLIGLFLMVSGSAKNAGPTVEAAMMPLNALAATAPWGVLVPLASLALLNLVLYRRVKASLPAEAGAA